MSGVDLWQEIQDTKRLLDIALKEAKARGIAKNAAEAKYYTVKDLRVRELMDEGKSGRISTGNSDLGVRPAIHVDLTLLSILSGSGTMASPYQLVPLGQESAAVSARRTPSATNSPRRSRSLR